MRTGHFRYEIIAEDLRQKILSGQHPVGSRLPAEPDLARQYGVNHLTLRKALGLLQSEGLLDRRPRRGTFILAQPVPTVGESSEAVLFFGRTEGHLHHELFQALVAAARERGASVYPVYPLSGAAPEAELAVRRLLSRGTPALAEEGSWPECFAQFPEAASIPVQLGFQDQAWPHRRGYHAVADCQRAGYLATRHLIELEHRCIAFIGTHPSGTTLEDALPGVHPTNPAYEGSELLTSISDDQIFCGL